MADVTVTIPDALLTGYNEARTSRAARGADLLPPASRATLEVLLRKLMKGIVQVEMYSNSTGSPFTLTAAQIEAL